MNDSDYRGDLSRAQVQQLLRPVNPSRVVTGSHVKPHLSQQDVVAHLIRVFGFGHFDIEVVEARLLFEEPITNKGGNPAWNVGYIARVRLTVRDERQQLVATYEGGSTGESDGQPSRADSHDLAFKSALSTATKRAAIHLGDQFGLSLYNKGQMEPLVRGTMVGVPAREDADVQEGVAQQEEDGGAVADRQDADAEASQETPPAPAGAPAKRATTGTQGTKRKRTAPVDKPKAPEEPASAPQEPEPAAEAPAPTPDASEAHSEPTAPEEPTPEPAEDPAEVAEREERARIAAEQEEAQRQRDEQSVSPEAIAKLRERQAAEVERQHAHLQATKPAPADDEAARAERQRARLDERLAEEHAREAAEAPAEEPWPADEPEGPTPYEVAANEEFGDQPEGYVPNYQRLVDAARNQIELRAMYDEGTKRGHMNTALRALVVTRKSELPET